MYQLKSAIKGAVGRSAYLAGAVFMLGGLVAAALPTVVHADALNPLTERSLLLTSSSPGFHYLDGSGNTTYAPPGSGPNGKQTGETFTFKVSTDSVATNKELKAFTFQYCTAAAGECLAPGDAGAGADDATHSNLDVNYTSPVQNTDFEIWVGGVKDTSGDWEMTTANKEDATVGTLTGRNNFITLVNSNSSTLTPIKPTAGTQIKVVFLASSTNYITNPGSGSFFVKINDYNDDTDTDPITSTHIVDGGVTVANVMTDSIQIQTKVLETMSFSVGTKNPDTVALTLPAKHGPCDAITENLPIKLGSSTAEYSLSPGHAYDGKSYWRLSSNSSGGATVYYSGATLSNTVNDQIDAIGNTAALSHPGMEQFGLAIDDSTDTFPTDFTDQVALDPNDKYKMPELDPLVASAEYGGGDGLINETDYNDNTALFAFKPDALDSPAPIASESADVVSCSTAKIRYIANIGADTPAGVYTTKINYLAAPQY